MGQPRGSRPYDFRLVDRSAAERVRATITPERMMRIQWPWGRVAFAHVAQHRFVTGYAPEYSTRQYEYGMITILQVKGFVRRILG